MKKSFKAHISPKSHYRFKIQKNLARNDVGGALNQKLAAPPTEAIQTPAVWEPQCGSYAEDPGNVRPGKSIILGFMHH